MNTSIQTPQEGDLDFLNPYKVESESFSLSSDVQVSIQKYSLSFNEWKGEPILNTYNGKAVIDWNGEPVFAELAVLRLFQSHGWKGVWVDSYRRKYRIGLPDVVEPIELPEEKKNFIESFRAIAGRSGGCWDVLVWKGDKAFFIELKRQKRDAIKESQIDWLRICLENGLNTANFALIEWKMP